MNVGKNTHSEGETGSCIARRLTRLSSGRRFVSFKGTHSQASLGRNEDKLVLIAKVRCSYKGCRMLGHQKFAWRTVSCQQPYVFGADAKTILDSYHDFWGRLLKLTKMHQRTAKDQMTQCCGHHPQSVLKSMLAASEHLGPNNNSKPPIAWKVDKTGVDIQV